MARTLPSARRSASILLGGAALATLALLAGWPAIAQGPALTAAATASGLDPALVDLAARLGLPGVLLILGLRWGQALGRAVERLSAWRPIVEIRLSTELAERLDAIEDAIRGPEPPERPKRRQRESPPA